MTSMADTEEVLRIGVVFSLSAMANLMRFVAHYEQDSVEVLFGDHTMELASSSCWPREEDLSNNSSYDSDTVSTSCTGTTLSIPPSDQALCDERSTKERAAASLRFHLKRQQSTLNTLLLLQTEDETIVSSLRTELVCALECSEAKIAVLRARMERLDKKLRKAHEKERRRGEVLEQLREELGDWRRRQMDDNAAWSSFRSLASW
mmetsp:Transcript_24/g.44  ORF Transcript_24/g.44 Transcript_24/m.44 type:complete len:205 (-) Transcript_24:25-639(-)